MCHHDPQCPPAEAVDREAAHVVARRIADEGRRVLEDALTRAAMHTGTWEGHEAGLLIGAMLETKFPEAG